MYRVLPSAQLGVCPNAGHDLPETHPAWFAQTVVDVLNTQDTATT
jgi:pimeloyl-ACP methyl ester carboxylesterase